VPTQRSDSQLCRIAVRRVIAAHSHPYLQDTSTGKTVAEHKTKLGRCDVLALNPHNGVLAAGHGNGTVTMWSPNMSTPLVKLLSHRGPVRAAAIDRQVSHLTSATAR
jgi:U3 small nucleolar RNA-associated protein 7